MSKIPMLEQFAAQSLVEHDGEFIFSKEKFAELIVRECAQVANDSNQSKNRAVGVSVGDVVREHFGVEE